MSWTVLLLRLYMKNTQLTIRTDPYSLKSILNLTVSVGRLARWCLRLSSYEFDVVHRAVIKHQAADALFCLQTTRKDRTSLEEHFSVLAIEVFENEESIRITYTNCEKSSF